MHLDSSQVLTLNQPRIAARELAWVVDELLIGLVPVARHSVGRIDAGHLIHAENRMMAERLACLITNGIPSARGSRNVRSQATRRAIGSEAHELVTQAQHSHRVGRGARCSNGGVKRKSSIRPRSNEEIPLQHVSMIGSRTASQVKRPSSKIRNSPLRTDPTGRLSLLAERLWP